MVCNNLRLILWHTLESFWREASHVPQINRCPAWVHDEKETMQATYYEDFKNPGR